MTTRQLPFMSVVVCTYNGQTVVGRAIESLLAQDYPKDRYEIIVVNDGSKDRTAAVVASYPVRLINHPKNRGISAGRNTGLEAAKGDVYVDFDDDCIVAPNWLRELARGYELPNIAGVSSFIGHPAKLHGVADHYMAATGSGNPPAIELNAHASVVQRFWGYIKSQIRPMHLTAKTIVPVRQVNGATASFPVSILKAVGGWNTRLANMEDTELCDRILTAFPHLAFYGVPSAIVVHDPKMSFQQMIRRQYIRGVSNLAYYRENHLVLPLFPFPIAWLAGSMVATLISPLLGLAALVLLPSLLYFWWDVRAVSEHKASYLILPYVQMSEELAALAGLARAYLKTRRSAA